MALHEAARAGDIDAARKLLSEGGENIDSRDKHNRTPLHMAAWAGKADMVQLLCENKANVNVTAGDDMSPLHFACQKGHLEAVRVLLAGGGKVSACSRKGLSPLHYAVQGQNLAVIKLVARRGGGHMLKLLNKKGESPLDMAKDEEVRNLLNQLDTELSQKFEKKAEKKAGKGKRDRDSHGDVTAGRSDNDLSNVGSDTLSVGHSENGSTGNRERDVGGSEGGKDAACKLDVEAGVLLDTEEPVRSSQVFGDEPGQPGPADDVDKASEVIGPLAHQPKGTAGQRKKQKVELSHLGTDEDVETDG